MKGYLPFILFSLLCFSFNSWGQQKFTLSGSISESSSNETLIGVTVAIPELNTGVTTNEYGFYSITLPEGTYTVLISYLGFEDIIQEITLTENKRIDYLLKEEAEQLDEVVVTENVEKMDIRKPQMSVNTLSIGTIKK
ncbi:MAG TPA: carboxypeptidase-like regulatory domain-containing protein, partial [Maribacter sp.]|nr:carboxypeptidase-like regulatory domain-containing protein [Maribacter sp.]